MDNILSYWRLRERTSSFLSPASPSTMILHVVLLLLLKECQESQGQQSYVDNKQLNCELNSTNALGYLCNGAATSCQSYLTFRSNPPYYNNPVNIAYLLGSDAADIAAVNNISDVDILPVNTLVIVPVNCSCSSSSASSNKPSYYQHNASYVLKDDSENYFTVSNNTYQGLTTCQSMISQNPSYNYRNLVVDLKLTVPLICACPTSNQTAAGIKYLLSYLVTWGDYYESIASSFAADVQSIYIANQLSPDHLIYPFTPLLVPLKKEPTPPLINASSSFQQLPPPPPSFSPFNNTPPTATVRGSNSRKWVFVSVALGAALLIILLSAGFLLRFFRYRQGLQYASPPNKLTRSTRGRGVPAESETSQSKQCSVTSQDINIFRDAIKFGSLMVYKFEDLQKATASFSDGNRIGGSVYLGTFNGDYAAVKRSKGDMSSEINILKHIHHSKIIRLSGFCLHEGDTYLVYEYVEKGSLSDLLHLNKSLSSSPSTVLDVLGWKQRVQIAYDIADALNYLHNFTKSPYIHKNLKSGNILLDGNTRAKVSNFGSARSLENPDEGCLQMTRHVVGTHGYMAPEYIENGLITPKLDVFAFGVVMLELLSGRNACTRDGSHHPNDEEKYGNEEAMPLSAIIQQVLGDDNVKEKLKRFIDPLLGQDYPLELAYSMAQLARSCVSPQLNFRPTTAEVLVALSKILSSSLDWDPSDELDTHSR